MKHFDLELIIVANAAHRGFIRMARGWRDVHHTNMLENCKWRKDECPGLADWKAKQSAGS